MLPQSELHLARRPVFQFNLSDLESGETGQTLKLPISIHAVFSSFLLEPQQLLDFGIRRCGHQPEPQAIHIKNTGLLPLTYRLEPGEIKLESIREKSLRLGDASSQEHLAHNPFALDKTEGMLEPDSTDCLMVSFDPQGDCNFSQNLLFRVENAPAKKNNTCVRLLGTSCLPTIDVSDVRSIFEEHRVSQNRVPQDSNAYYCIADSLFFFGVHPADMDPSPDEHVSPFFSLTLQKREIFISGLERHDSSI